MRRAADEKGGKCVKIMQKCVHIKLFGQIICVSQKIFVTLQRKLWAQQNNSLRLKLARLRARTCIALRFALRSPQKLKIVWGPQKEKLRKQQY